MGPLRQQKLNELTYMEHNLCTPKYFDTHQSDVSMLQTIQSLQNNHRIITPLGGMPVNNIIDYYEFRETSSGDMPTATLAPGKVRQAVMPRLLQDAT